MNDRRDLVNRLLANRQDRGKECQKKLGFNPFTIKWLEQKHAEKQAERRGELEPDTTKDLVYLEDLKSIEWRKKAGRPHLLIDSVEAINNRFSRMDAFKRAIAAQTEAGGFVPKSYFKPLIEGVDFEVVSDRLQSGFGKKSKTVIYINEQVLVRVIYGNVGDWASPDGLSVRDQLNTKFEAVRCQIDEMCDQSAYERTEGLRSRFYAIMGYCPYPNQFWTLQRELKHGRAVTPTQTLRQAIDADFESGGYIKELYLMTDEAIAENKRAIANNKNRMPQRVKRMMSDSATWIKVSLRDFFAKH